jgi:hypothetical protein
MKLIFSVKLKAEVRSSAYHKKENKVKDVTN